MNCLNPRTIRNPRYKDYSPEALNHYARRLFPDLCVEVPIEYIRFNRDYPSSKTCALAKVAVPPDYYITIPCGHCSKCRQARAAGWRFRILQEIQESGIKDCAFLTLTYQDGCLPKDNQEAILHIRKYIDLLRKALGYRPRYFITSELGSKTHRFHWHGLLFNVRITPRVRELLKRWKYGFIYVEKVDLDAPKYVTKYMSKQCYDASGAPYDPIIMVSRGIGRNYVTVEHVAYHMNPLKPVFVAKFGGQFYPLPPYYRALMLDDLLRLRMTIAYYKTPPSTVYKLGGKTYTDYKEYILARAAAYAADQKLLGQPFLQSVADALYANRYTLPTNYDIDSSDAYYEFEDSSVLSFGLDSM